MNLIDDPLHYASVNIINLLIGYQQNHSTPASVMITEESTAVTPRPLQPLEFIRAPFISAAME